MAGAVANLSVLLTAKTGRFAADMRKVRRPLVDLQRSVRTVQRGVRAAFAFVALRGLTSALTGAVMKARELGVSLDAASHSRLDGLARSIQAMQFAVSRLVVRIVADLAPALRDFIDKITAAALWIDGKMSPGVLRLAKNTAVFTAAAVAAAAAIKTIIVVQRLWNARAKIGVVLQATLAALTGNWVALAAGAAVFGGTIIGVNAAFKEFGEDGKRSVGGVNAEVEKLTRSMRGLGDVRVGRLGRDFAPITAIQGHPQLRQLLQPQTDASGVERALAIENRRREQDRIAMRRGGEGSFSGRFRDSRNFR